MKGLIPGSHPLREEPDINHDRRTHQVFERYFLPCLIPEGSSEIQARVGGRDEVGRGVKVGAAVLVHNDEVGLVGVGAPGLACWAMDLGEPVPVVVGVGHVPWPRTREPLRYGQ